MSDAHCLTALISHHIHIDTGWHKICTLKLIFSPEFVFKLCGHCFKANSKTKSRKMSRDEQWWTICTLVPVRTKLLQLSLKIHCDSTTHDRYNLINDIWHCSDACCLRFTQNAKHYKSGSSQSDTNVTRNITRFMATSAAICHVIATQNALSLRPD